MKSKRNMLGVILVLAALALMLAVSPLQAAQEKYPVRPVKIILTHKAGGWSGTNAHLVAPYIEKHLGVPIVLEVMEGAGGRRARTFVYKAAPDGYTLLINAFPTSELGELLYQGDYKTLNFKFVHTFGSSDYTVMAVSATSPFKSYKEMVEQSKSKPVKLGTSGTGTPDHLAVTLMKHYTGLKAVAVPFETGADALMAVLGNKLDGLPVEASTLGGRKDLKGLVALAPKRVDVIPAVPTIKEEGYPLFEVTSSLGIMAPPGLPEEMRKILEDAVAKAVADPEYIDKLEKAKGVRPLSLKGPEFKKMVEAYYKGVQDVLPILLEDVKK